MSGENPMLSVLKALNVLFRAAELTGEEQSRVLLDYLADSMPFTITPSHTLAQAPSTEQSRSGIAGNGASLREYDISIRQKLPTGEWKENEDFAVFVVENTCTACGDLKIGLVDQRFTEEEQDKLTRTLTHK